MLRYTEQLELDLHRIFVDGALGLTIVLDDLFAPPYRFPLAGYELAALPMPQRLLHACYVAALGDWPPRLVSFRDVVELVLREKPNLLDVLLMARSWRCEVVVARAVSNAWEELGVTERPPIVEWAHRYEPTRLDRLLLAAHEGPARMFTRHLAAIVVLPGVAERARYHGRDRVPAAHLPGGAGLVGRPARQARRQPGAAVTGFGSRGFRALGYRFALQVEGDDVLGPYVASLFEAFPPTDDGVEQWHLGPAADASGNWALVVDGAAQATAEHPEQLVSPCVHHLNRLAIASWDGVVCHAGGVVRDGVGVLLPAHMESGKSTLTAGLVRAGARYLSDEGVAFPRDTAVMQPYAKPLSIDPGAWYLFPELEPDAPFTTDGYKDAQWQVPPTCIRPSAVAGPCAARLVVFPQYVAGADTTIAPLRRAEALVELAKNTFAFNRKGRDALDQLAGVVRAVDCYRMTVGDLDRAVALVGELVARFGGGPAA